MNAFTKLDNHTTKRDNKCKRRQAMRVSNRSIFIIQAQIIKRGHKSEPGHRSEKEE